MKIKKNKLVKLACGIGLLTLGFACQKTELEPSIYGDPILFVRGKFKDKIVDLTVGKPGISGTPFIFQDSLNVARVYAFTLFDSLTLFSPTVTLSFINYAASTGSLAADIDSTFKPGNKEIAELFNVPTNPFQLNTFTFEIADTADYYTSRKLFTDDSYCKIDSVKDRTWYDDKLYKLVYLSFSCKVVRANNPLDSSRFFDFSEGKATLAFPKK